MMADYGVGALGGVVLIDPATGLPYKAEGGGGGGAVASVNGKTGAVVLSAGDVGAATSAQGALAATAVQSAGLTKAAVGLGSVDNTSDANKPVSTAQAAAIAAVAASVTAQQMTVNMLRDLGAEPQTLMSGVTLQPINSLNEYGFDPTAPPPPVELMVRDGAGNGIDLFTGAGVALTPYRMP